MVTGSMLIIYINNAASETGSLMGSLSKQIANNSVSHMISRGLQRVRVAINRSAHVAHKVAVANTFPPSIAHFGSS